MSPARFGLYELLDGVLRLGQLTSARGRISASRCQTLSFAGIQLLSWGTSPN
jgi:hypothetical protein